MKDNIKKNHHNSKEDNFEGFEGTPEEVVNAEVVDNPDAVEDEETPAVDESVAGDADPCAALEEELAKQKKEYLFLMAEFDNFRKRTLKEKSEIIKNAGEQVLKGLLPIVDDFERGIRASESADNAQAVVEGMKLIYNKLIKFLASNGVKAFDPDDREFDTERHEAISVVPVSDEAQKGKILDTVEKGYMINDKVLRHAKVVVGQ